MELAAHTWQELEEYLEETSLALVPVGSTEQHGPHLPESTDHTIAEALAQEAAERGDYLCTPTVNIGVSPHHKQFAGTMWVDAPVFRDYMESLVRNLTYHGIDRVVFVNAHGGNVEHLQEVGRRLYDDEVAYSVEWMWDNSIPDLVDDLFEQNGPHAGPKETSMVWYIEDNVREEKLEEARDGGLVDLEDAETMKHGARTFYDAVDNSGNGGFGDPTDASAEKGKQLFEAASEQLVHLCDWMAAQDAEDLMPASRVAERSE
ncbi:creatininase family protein [Halobaculum magnesiiphilum]|uniref:Creatininase family protein n=1 Tax=Halobaculum magnesiiphilum TaxID=1017351 RepID=A0A8T8WFB3_9EURY|nr:creatininase family protein [Halobaculum magnesiiphilum]QZP38535.1 creatininase family protein [Halobaculum magnesiiphilum]